MIVLKTLLHSQIKINHHLMKDSIQILRLWFRIIWSIQTQLLWLENMLFMIVRNPKILVHIIKDISIRLLKNKCSIIYKTLGMIIKIVDSKHMVKRKKIRKWMRVNILNNNKIEL
jgi:hypothetical protein